MRINIKEIILEGNAKSFHDGNQNLPMDHTGPTIRATKYGKLNMGNPEASEKFTRRASNQFINKQALANKKNLAVNAIGGALAGGALNAGIGNLMTNTDMTSDGYDVMDARSKSEDALGLDLPGTTFDRSDAGVLNASTGAVAGAVGGLAIGAGKAMEDTFANSKTRANGIVNRVKNSGYEFNDYRYDKRARDKLYTALKNGSIIKTNKFGK